MLQDDVLIGGEESGGIGIKGHIPEGDGVLMGLLLLEIMADAGVPLHELVARHPADGRPGLLCAHRPAPAPPGGKERDGGPPRRWRAGKHRRRCHRRTLTPWMASSTVWRMRAGCSSAPPGPSPCSVSMPRHQPAAWSGHCLNTESRSPPVPRADNPDMNSRQIWSGGCLLLQWMTASPKAGELGRGILARAIAGATAKPVPEAPILLFAVA